MTEHERDGQLAFDGETAIAGDLQTLVAYVFEKYPETRDDNKLLLFYFWLEHCGLVDALTYRAQCPACRACHEVNLLDHFQEWLVARGRLPSTIFRRQREKQNDEGEFKPSPEVQKERKLKSRQGAVKF